MKKLLLATLLMLTTFTTSASGLWSLVKNSGMETLPSKPYQIEVRGTNIRAYLFDVPPNAICVYLSLGR